jgi:hypothetical protein
MPGDDEATPIEVPRPRATTAHANAPLRVLSLTGGGYRGLFTAQVLVHLCEQARVAGPLDAALDVFAGTSIGGLMSCALAVGIAPRRVLDVIDAYGPAVFPPKRWATARRFVFGSLYDPGNLAKAIDACLGRSVARMKLRDVKAGLLVPAVDWVGGRAEVFMSGFFGKSHASDASLRDVCLATAAAPTYFAPHEVDGAPMLDGGLTANNPDVLALMEIVRRMPQALDRIEMLSIGTAGADAARAPAKADKSGAGWAPDLALYMITVQERTAAALARRLLRERYLRVNHEPEPGARAFDCMDEVNDETRTALLEAGAIAAKEAYKSSGPFIDRMLAHGRRRAAPR